MFKKGFQSDQNRNVRMDQRQDNLQQSQEIYQSLKQIFDMRIEQYDSTIRSVCEKLIDDELIETLKKDKISLEFVQVRIKEIIQESLDDEKETIVEKVSLQYAKLKSDYQTLDEAYNQLQTQQEDLKFKYAQDIQEYENKFEALSSEMDKQRKQVDIVNQQNLNKIKNQEMMIENKTSIINQLEMQLVESVSNQQLNGLNTQQYETRNNSFIKNSYQNIDQQSMIIKDQEIQSVKISLNELQSKLNQQIQASSAQEEEIFEVKKLNRQLQEENRKLVLQAQQVTNTSIQIESRYKKELDQIKNQLQEQLHSTQEKLKSQKDKYKSKNESLKTKIEEFKQKILEIQEESLKQIEQFKNEKRNLIEQIDIIKNQCNYEVQMKQTELAYTLQTNNSNFEEQKLKMRFDLNEQLDKQLKSLRQTYEQDIAKMKKREQEIQRKYEEQIQDLIIQNKQVENNFYQNNDYTSVKFENEKLKQEIVTLKTEHSFLLNQQIYNTQNVTAKNDSLEEQIVILQKQIGKLEIDLEKSKKQYNHIKSEEDSINSKVLTLQRERDQAILDKKQTVKNIDLFERQKNEIEKKYETKKQEAQTTLVFFEQLKEKYGVVEQELTFIKNDRDQLSQTAFQEINDLKIENMKLQKDNEQQKLQIELFMDQKKEQKDQLQSIKEENVKLNEKVAQLVQQNNSHSQEKFSTISQLQIDVKNYQLQFQDKVQKMEKIREENQDLKINEEVRKKQISSLEDQIAELKQNIKQREKQIHNAENKLVLYKQRFEKCKLKLKEVFIQILDSIRLEQESLKIQFTRSLYGLQESSEETILQLQMTYQNLFIELKSQANEKPYLSQQIIDLKQQLNEQNRQNSARQKQEIENQQQIQERNKQTIRTMKTEITELKKKNNNQIIQINQNNEKFIEVQIDFKKVKQEKERLQETVDQLYEEISQVQQENQEKTEKINHWKNQEQMSNSLEMERLQKHCQSEINVYQDKIQQMQRRQETLMDFYNEQLKSIQNEYFSILKKNNLHQ